MLNPAAVTCPPALVAVSRGTLSSAAPLPNRNSEGPFPEWVGAAEPWEQGETLLRAPGPNLHDQV